MKPGNIVCGFVVVCLLSVVCSVVKGAEGDAGATGTEVRQSDPTLSEVLNRSPVSKEAQDLRGVARKAQKDYFAARAENPQIRNIERQIVKRGGHRDGPSN